MGKHLKDGESREIQSHKKGLGLFGDQRINVTAHRVNADTPYVILKIEGRNEPLVLTDVGAIELVARLDRALSILPFSK